MGNLLKLKVAQIATKMTFHVVPQIIFVILLASFTVKCKLICSAKTFPFSTSSDSEIGVSCHLTCLNQIRIAPSKFPWLALWKHFLSGSNMLDSQNYKSCRFQFQTEYPHERSSITVFKDREFCLFTSSFTSRLQNEIYKA